MTRVVCVTVYRLVAEMPPTSGVVTTPDVLIVKLVPDATIGTLCLFIVAGLLAFYVIQALVGVSITCNCLQTFNGLSTLATIVAQFGDCRQNRQLLPNSVAVFGNSRRFQREIVAEIGEYSLQCGQALTRFSRS